MKPDIYYCFKYKCKNCPKQRKCEEELRGDTIERRKSNTNEPKKRERS